MSNHSGELPLSAEELLNIQADLTQWLSERVGRSHPGIALGLLLDLAREMVRVLGTDDGTDPDEYFRARVEDVILARSFGGVTH